MKVRNGCKKTGWYFMEHAAHISTPPVYAAMNIKVENNATIGKCLMYFWPLDH